MRVIDKVIDAGKNGGWAMALIVAVTALALVYLRAPEVINAPLPGDTTVKTVARAPGPDFDVSLFCADPATKVAGAAFLVPDSRWAYKYTLSRGNESIEWLTSANTDPNQQNLTASHYLIPPSGLQQGLPQVEMTPAAAKCIWSKGGAPK